MAFILAGAALWLPLLNHLQLEWSINEQYQYGFFVPFLAGYLAWLRWTDRPPARPLSARGWLSIPAVASLLAISLIMLIEGANQDWRMLSWLWSGLAVFVTALGVFAIGGASWLRHFLFPLCFIFVAVPWPMASEMRIINELTARNAAAAAELLNWFGVHAEHVGNAVRIAKADIGIDDACSGVRSVQASIMVGCLFGEMYRLPIVARTLLVSACLVAALVGNLARTISLVWLADARGEAAMNAWHDQIGLVVLAVSWGAWYLLAKVVSSAVKKTDSSELISSGTRSAHDEVREESHVSHEPLPAWCCCCVVALMAFSVLGVEAWYGSGDSRHRSTFSWTAHAPAAEQVVESRIPDRARAILRFSSGTNWRWEDAAGFRWSAFHLRWDAGRTAANLAGSHRPDVCLPASGRIFVEDCGVVPLLVSGSAMPFRHYVFKEGEEPLHVFFHLSSQGAETSPSMSSSVRLTPEARMSSVLERRRNEGQQQLEVALWGVEDADEARRKLTKALSGRLVWNTDVGIGSQLSARSFPPPQPPDR